jgi:hypothetical protein
MASCSCLSRPPAELVSYLSVHSPLKLPPPLAQIGDWGRQGGNNESAVAELMALQAAQQPPQFVISTGDNFYPSACGSFQDPKPQIPKLQGPSMLRDADL